MKERILAEEMRKRDGLVAKAGVLRGQSYDLRNLCSCLMHPKYKRRLEGQGDYTAGVTSEEVRLAIAQSLDCDEDLKRWVYGIHEKGSAEYVLFHSGNLGLEIGHAFKHACERLAFKGLTYDSESNEGRNILGRFDILIDEIREEKEKETTRQVVETMRRYPDWRQEYSRWREEYFAQVEKLKQDKDFPDRDSMGHHCTKAGFYLDCYLK
jgi:hypothetical protein